jgi:hypothetical protein
MPNKGKEWALELARESNGHPPEDHKGTGETAQRTSRLSNTCYVNEHKHCGGLIKYTNVDNTDDCYPCNCPCHASASQPHAAALLPNNHDEVQRAVSEE